MAPVNAMSPLRALYMVFVRPALAAHHVPALLSRAHFRAPMTSISSRTFTTSPPHYRLLKPSKARARAELAASSSQVRPRNTSIPARYVRIVDNDGKLGPQLTRTDVLCRIDPAQDDLVCLEKPPEYMTAETHGIEYEEYLARWGEVVREYGRQRERLERLKAGEGRGSGAEDRVEGGVDSEAAMRKALRKPGIWMRRDRCIRLPSGEEWIPVCKVVNRGEEKAKEDEARKQKKEMRKWAPDGIKVLEFNWATEPGDLKHRLKKVQELLRKRHKVEIMVAPKKRGRQASRTECVELIAKMKAAIGEVEGAKETRPMQGTMGQVVSIMAEGERGKEAMEKAFNDLKDGEDNVQSN